MEETKALVLIPNLSQLIPLLSVAPSHSHSLDTGAEHMHHIELCALVEKPLSTSESVKNHYLY